jgi:hypothetical protein
MIKRSKKSPKRLYKKSYKKLRKSSRRHSKRHSKRYSRRHSKRHSKRHSRRHSKRHSKRHSRRHSRRKLSVIDSGSEDFARHIRKNRHSRRHELSGIDFELKKNKSIITNGFKDNNLVVTNTFISKNPDDKLHFKLIELKGCSACTNAKNLIKSKGHHLEVKSQLNPEEAEIIKNTVGVYEYFPKIFKLNKKTGKYDFIGGYDKISKMI